MQERNFNSIVRRYLEPPLQISPMTNNTALISHTALIFTAEATHTHMTNNTAVISHTELIGFLWPFGGRAAAPFVFVGEPTGVCMGVECGVGSRASSRIL